jgi:thiamine-monophosphate kinase
MNEFDIIANFFRPLACKEALNLQDDAACFQPSPDHELVVTTDMMMESVHFLPNTPAYELGRKILAVNISDLAAMGATPCFYTLSIGLTKKQDAAWLQSFVNGLQAEQTEHQIALLGGDTIASPHSLTLSITAFGEVKKGMALRRSAAQENDNIYVSGRIGGGFLGLKALQENAPHAYHHAASRYTQPEARVELGKWLQQQAIRAAADCSDGLLADTRNIARASNLTAVIEAVQVPLWLPNEMVLEQLTGGDDYELIFTAPPIWKPVNPPVAVTKIGVMHRKKDENLVLLDKNGKTITPPQLGFSHEP